VCFVVKDNALLNKGGHMRTSYAFDEEMGEGITIDEKEKDSSQKGGAAENTTSASKVGAARVSY